MTDAGAAHLTESEIGDLTDGDVDDATRHRLQRHVEGCPHCAHEVRAAHLVNRWSAEQPAAVTAPPELWTLVAAATIHRRAVRRQVLRAARSSLVAFALVLVTATAVVTWMTARWWFTSDEPQVRGVRVIGPGEHAGHPGTGSAPPSAPAAPQAPRPGPDR